MPRSTPLFILNAVRGMAQGLKTINSDADDFSKTSLMAFDRKAVGSTYLWEPFSKQLDQIGAIYRATPVAERRSCFVYTLDCSASMKSHQHLLDAMFSSVFLQGINVLDNEPSDESTNLRVVLITDGEDNESGGVFEGSQGIVEVFKRATIAGFDTGGDVLPEDPIGKLEIVLVDVSEDGGVAKRMETLDTPATLVATREPEVIARIVHNKRQTRLPRGRAPLDTWGTLPPAVAEKITRLSHTMNSTLDLKTLMDTYIDALDGGIRVSAREAVTVFIKKLLDGERLVVTRRGSTKNRFHTEINGILYAIAKHKSLEVTKESPRTWSLGVNSESLREQFELMDQDVLPVAKRVKSDT